MDVENDSNVWELLAPFEHAFPYCADQIVPNAGSSISSDAGSGDRIPIGVNVGWQPKRMEIVASIVGGGRVERLGRPAPTNVYQWQIDRLPPGQYIEFGILTSLRPWKAADFSFDTSLWAGVNEHPATRHFIDGTFQFDYHGARLAKRFFAPIGYDKEKRHQHLIEVLEGRRDWQAVALDVFS